MKSDCLNSDSSHRTLARGRPSWRCKRPDRFLALLREYEIQVLIDVRARPARRWCPQFNRRQLDASLKGVSIEYRWRGQFLGGLDATSIGTPAFVFDMREVLALAESRNVTLMCAERHPRDCHRATKLTMWLHHKVPNEGARQLHRHPTDRSNWSNRILAAQSGTAAPD